MNSEIHLIVENMKRGKKESTNSSDILVYQLGQMANLLSLLAIEAEAQNKTIADQTKETIRLTRAIYILTGVMVAIGIIQIALAVIIS